MTALERCYRRLLSWYPAGHRRAYGEEMIGVLLASARPAEPAGQGRGPGPDWRRAAGQAQAVADWRRPPACGSPGGVQRGRAGCLARLDGSRIPGQQNAAERTAAVFRRYQELVSTTHSAWLTVLIVTAVVVAVLAAWPVLARQGRLWAVAISGMIAAAAAVIGLVQVFRLGAPDNEFTLYFSLIAVMEVLALLASPGPARGSGVRRLGGA